MRRKARSSKRWRGAEPRKGAVLGLLLSFAGQFLAAKQDAGHLLDLSLEELLEIRVTGATLTDESVLSAPSAVSVFGAEAIAEAGIETLEELVNFVPGFQSFNTGESGHSAPFSSRGRKSGTTSREVLVLLDGMRIDTTLYGGTPFTLPMLSLANVERAEFIRGAGSALYGSNAFLGVINLVTKTDTDAVRLTAGVPRSGEAVVMRHLSLGPVEGQLFLRGFREEDDATPAVNTLTGLPTTVRRRVNGHDLQGRFTWGETELEWVSAHRSAPGFFIVGDLVDEFSGYETTFHRLGLAHRHRWSETQETTLRLGYRLWSENPHSELAPAGALAAVSDPPSTAALRAYTEMEESEWSVDLLHEWGIGAGGTLLLGGEWRYPEMEEATAFSNFSLMDLLTGTYPIHSAPGLTLETPQVAQASRDVFGAFAQYQQSVAEKLELTLGARFDRFSRAGSRVSPRIAAVYHAAPAWTLKAVYGEAFRAPSFTESSSINNPILSGNPALEAETTRSTDLILVWHTHCQVASLGYFHNEFSDGIVNGELGGLRTFVNAGRDRNAGIEFEYRAQLGEDWSVRLGFARMVEPLEDAFREADVMGSAIVNYRVGDWDLNLAGMYQGERERADGDPANRVRLPAVLEVNLNLRYHWKDWVLRCQVLNLFDRDNDTPPQSLNTRQNIPGRGRALRLGVERDF